VALTIPAGLTPRALSASCRTVRSAGEETPAADAKLDWRRWAAASEPLPIAMCVRQFGCTTLSITWMTPFDCMTF
jgi:hypothetical protein